MAHWAAKGVKCVCVDAGWPQGWGVPLVKGRVYTVEFVRSLDPQDWSNAPLDGAVAIGLAETQNPLADDGVFASTRFRPVISRPQSDDIAMFQRIAADAQNSIQVSEDA